MKIVLYNLYDDGLKEYLLSQEGITNVEICDKDFWSEVFVEFNEKTNFFIIGKYIDLYLTCDNNIISFDKGTRNGFKTLKYVVEDMCCEYCYKFLVSSLFNNKDIYLVNSNFDFNKPAYNIEFTIEYSENLKEKDIIEFINKNI